LTPPESDGAATAPVRRYRELRRPAACRAKRNKQPSLPRCDRIALSVNAAMPNCV